MASRVALLVPEYTRSASGHFVYCCTNTPIIIILEPRSLESRANAILSRF